MINMKKTNLLLAALVSTTAFILSCTPAKTDQSAQSGYFAQDTTLAFQTGGIKMIPVQTAKGKLNVWTKRTGNNPKIKVLMLAGGPGLPHDYLEVFDSFFPKEGIEYYYYDELGSGNSDKTTDTSRYTVAAAVEEVEQVRKALNLDKDNFYLYGHSWGGALAMEYAVKYQQNLKGLIVSNMSSSGTEFNRYVENVLSKEIPKSALDTIQLLTAKKEFSNPKYMELVMKHFYTKFICRMPLEQWPEPVNRALNKLNQTYYMKQQGPSEFGFLGELKVWDMSKRLKQIKVPTLMIGAKYDEMDPAHMKWMSTQVQKGKYLYCPEGSHLSMYDQQPFYMKGVIDFIKGVDQQ